MIVGYRVQQARRSAKLNWFTILAPVLQSPSAVANVSTTLVAEQNYKSIYKNILYQLKSLPNAQYHRKCVLTLHQMQVHKWQRFFSFFFLSYFPWYRDSCKNLSKNTNLQNMKHLSVAQTLLNHRQKTGPDDHHLKRPVTFQTTLRVTTFDMLLQDTHTSCWLQCMQHLREHFHVMINPCNKAALQL